MAIVTTKDGRTIRTGKHYQNFRIAIYLRAGEQCEHCFHSLTLEEMHVHHINGRGMGGGKRNDIPGEVLGLCGNCHRKEHNQ